MSLTARRRGLMGQNDGKIYLIKGGMLQPAIEGFNDIGYTRGSGTQITVTYGDGYIQFDKPGRQTAAKTTTNVIDPKGKTMLYVRCSLSNTMTNAQVSIAAAESVKTGASFAGAYTNYVREVVTSTDIVAESFDLTALQEGFYLSVSNDSWAASHIKAALKIYDAWME